MQASEFFAQSAIRSQAIVLDYENLGGNASDCSSRERKAKLANYGE